MVTCEQLSTISNFFSTVSLGSWICAQLPQIYTNFKNKSAEGISPSFLLLWFMGDFLSFTSCLFNDAVLNFQIWLSVFFLCNDITLCCQYYYYNSVYPRKYGFVQYTSLEGATNPRGSHDSNEDFAITNNSMIHSNSTNSIHIRPNHVTPSEEPFTSSSPLTPPKGSPQANGYSSMNTFSDNKSQSAIKTFAVGSMFNSITTTAMPINEKITKVTETTQKSTSGSEAFGLFLAWGCTFVYMSSRCPQLYKNYLRKSVEGISPLLFGAALLGNLAYTLSILSSCEFVLDESRGEFFFKELPYILGSSGTIIFDAIYFYQRHIYRDSGKQTSVMGLETWDELGNTHNNDSTRVI